MKLTLLYNRPSLAKAVKIIFLYFSRLRAVSLFLENRGEERKTNERASVISTVSVMCERRFREPLVVWASEDE